MQVVRWTSPAGKRRLLTVLDPAGAARYRRVTRLALPRLRTVPGSAPAGRTWQQERAAWRAVLRAELATAEVAVASDVVDCFPSIGPGAIERAVVRAGGDAEPLLGFLAEAHAAGITGLPIGPPASAVIADAVLAIADEQARVGGIPPIRWVDDVVFAGDRGTVARAERAWRRALRDLGLRDHEGKRRELADEDGVRLGLSLPRGRARVIMRSS
jgi:hypothetical protein